MFTNELIIRILSQIYQTEIEDHIKKLLENN